MVDARTSRARGVTRAVDGRQPDIGEGPLRMALADGPNPNVRTENSLPLSPNLASISDEINRDIIRMLQDDGRMPYAKIAAALGVAEGTVRNRVNLMKQSGILRIIAVVDPIAIDYIADAMLGIIVAPDTDPVLVAERLARVPEVHYILWVGGRYDLLVEVVFDRREDFLKFMLTECYGQSDIARIETMNGLAMLKNQFLLKQHVP